MSGEPVLPDRRALIELHRLTIERHGGAPGIRDEGALDAALARPRQLLAYADPGAPSVFDLAAALAVSLTRHRHPFVDGNKRMGLIASYVMLRLNGDHLDATEADAARVVLAVAEGALDEAGFADWLRRHAPPVERLAD